MPPHTGGTIPRQRSMPPAPRQNRREARDTAVARRLLAYAVAAASVLGTAAAGRRSSGGRVAGAKTCCTWVWLGVLPKDGSCAETCCSTCTELDFSIKAFVNVENGTFDGLPKLRSLGIEGTPGRVQRVVTLALAIAWTSPQLDSMAGPSPQTARRSHKAADTGNTDASNVCDGLAKKCDKKHEDDASCGNCGNASLTAAIVTTTRFVKADSSAKALGFVEGGRHKMVETGWCRGKWDNRHGCSKEMIETHVFHTEWVPIIIHADKHHRGGSSTTPAAAHFAQNNNNTTTALKFPLQLQSARSDMQAAAAASLGALCVGGSTVILAWTGSGRCGGTRVVSTPSVLAGAVLLAHITPLQELELDDNELTSLPSGVFDSLAALEYLWLEENELTCLPSGVFDSLTALEELGLKGNKLSLLSSAYTHTQVHTYQLLKLCLYLCICSFVYLMICLCVCLFLYLILIHACTNAPCTCTCTYTQTDTCPSISVELGHTGSSSPVPRQTVELGHVGSSAAEDEDDTQTGTGLWYKIAGGPTDRAYGCLGSIGALEQYIGPPISLGARAALVFFAFSCLAQLITYFYLAVEASMSVNVCKSFARMNEDVPKFGSRRYGGDCRGGKKGMYTGTMALSIIAGIIYVVGLVACVYFPATLAHNRTKARARQQYFVMSSVMASGAFFSFIATILWTAATEGMVHQP